MAKKNGVDPKAVVEMLTHTLFPAPIYQSYGQRIAEKTAPFSQSEIPLKDVGLFKKTAQQVESPTPISSLVYDLLRSDEGRAYTLPTVPQPITDDLLFEIIIPDNPLPLLGTEASAARK
jgi:3-hydroxyisobutyrate dehydrogenase-like beta-hydroxyacid dehydrogenase